MISEKTSNATEPRRQAWVDAEQELAASRMSAAQRGKQARKEVALRKAKLNTLSRILSNKPSPPDFVGEYTHVSILDPDYHRGDVYARVLFDGPIFKEGDRVIIDFSKPILDSLITVKEAGAAGNTQPAKKATLDYTNISIEGPQFTPKYDFDADNEGELSVKEGDVVTVLSHNNPLWNGWYENWALAAIDNKYGFLPQEYVTRNMTAFAFFEHPAGEQRRAEARAEARAHLEQLREWEAERQKRHRPAPRLPVNNNALAAPAAGGGGGAKREKRIVRAATGTTRSRGLSWLLRSKSGGKKSKKYKRKTTKKKFLKKRKTNKKKFLKKRKVL